MLMDMLKESLRLMKKNVNLSQYIILLFIVVSIFAPVLAATKINFKIIPMGIAFFGFICAFMSGLYFVFKKSLEFDKNIPKQQNELELPPFYFSEFLQGIGQYITKFIFAGFLVLALFALLLLGYGYIIHNYIEIPQKFVELAQSSAVLDNAKIVEFIENLTLSEQAAIGKLGLFTMFAMGLFGYITMLYPVALVNEEKNFFLSFFSSLKILFKNFPISLIIFLFFNIILSFAGMISAAFANNIILSLISILLQCYVNVWYILSLFVYYEKTK